MTSDYAEGPPVTAARDLTPGDWVHEDTGELVRVVAVIPWDNGVGIVCQKPGMRPYLADSDPRHLFRTATDAELAAEGERQRRAAVAVGLRDFAALMSRGLPLPQPGEPVDVTVRLPDRESVDAAAKTLGVDVIEGKSEVSAEWESDAERSVVALLFWPLDTEYRREVDNGDPDAVIPEGVAGQAIGRAAVPEPSTVQEGGE